MGYTPKDHHFRQAKREGKRARSAFKIEEIAQRLHLLKPGISVLDLGAAPGGFLQVIAGVVGPKGRVVGVDRVAIAPFTGLPHVTTVVADVLAETVEALSKKIPGTFDVVVSDLAPKTTGVRSTDQARSVELAQRALDVALHSGAQRSHFVTKIFMGEDLPQFRRNVAAHYDEERLIRPEATRSASFEVYVIGLRRKSSPLVGE